MSVSLTQEVYADDPLAPTSDRTSQWEDIVQSDQASRVISVLNLALTTKETNRWRDTVKDILPVSEALVWHLDTNGGEGSVRENQLIWRNLLDAGVIDTLCRCVMVNSASQVIKRMMLSSFWKPEDLLLLAACHLLHFSSLNTDIASPLSSADRKFISPLRKQWSGMVQRLWEGRTKTPLYEQRCLSMTMLFQKVSRADPTFMDVIYSSTDFTVPLIARCWQQSTDADVTQEFMHAMMWCTRQQSDQEPASTIRTVDPPVHLPAQMLKGTGSPEKLFSKMATVLSTADVDSPRAFIQAIVSSDILDIARRACTKRSPRAHVLKGKGKKLPSDHVSTDYSDLFSVYFRSSAYWTNVFLFLRRASKFVTDPGSDYADFNAMLAQVTKSIADAHWLACQLGTTSDVVELVKVWVKADLLGTLDEIASRCLKRP